MSAAFLFYEVVMPYTNVPEELTGEMDRCVEKVMEQGKDKEAAIAICHASIVKGENVLSDGFILTAEAAKYGARNARDDKERVRKIRKAAREIDGITLELEPDDDDEKPESRLTTAKADGLPEQDLHIDFTTTIKAAGDWELDVLGVPFGGPNGGKDSDGEYFSPETKTYNDQFPNPPAVYYHGFSPEGKPMAEPEIIGQVKRIWRDAKGWWYRVVLDKTKDLSRRIMDSAKQGKARASSGSIAHMVRKDRDGRITHWPVVELSLIDADGKRQPANQYAVALLAAKAHYTLAGGDFPDITDDTEGEGGQQTAPDVGAATKTTEGANLMTPEEIQAITDQVKASMQAEAQAKAEKDKIVSDAIAAAKAQWEAEAAKTNRLPFDGQTPAELKIPRQYDNLDVADHALMIDLLNSRKRQGGPGASADAMKAYVKKVEAEAEKDKAAHFAKAEIKAAGFKSDEIDYSTLSSYGDEWVGIAYSTALWESIRVGTFVVNKLPTVEVPRGMESIYLPLESTDPVFYKVAENSTYDSTMKYPVPTVTSSRLGTSRVQLTLSKLGARVLWSGEMEERSLIPFVAQLRQQLQTVGAEYLESAIIDGDTATTYTTNINDIANTTDMTATEYCLVFNGFRKSPLVTTAANSRSAAGSLDVTDYIETVKLMGGAGINGLDRSKVSFIVDPSTYYKTLGLPEVLTRDVWASPTLEGGQLTGLWGYPLQYSANMHRYSSVRKANSAGKVDTDTTTNNAYGAILAVRWDQWKFGWQRRATIETFRWPAADTTEIVMMMSCGLIQRDTEASAITYYVGV